MLSEIEKLSLESVSYASAPVSRAVGAAAVRKTKWHAGSTIALRDQSAAAVIHGLRNSNIVQAWGRNLCLLNLIGELFNQLGAFDSLTIAAGTIGDDHLNGIADLQGQVVSEIDVLRDSTGAVPWSSKVAGRFARFASKKNRVRQIVVVNKKDGVTILTNCAIRPNREYVDSVVAIRDLKFARQQRAWIRERIDE